MKVLIAAILPFDVKRSFRVIAVSLALINYSCSKSPLPTINEKQPQVATQEAVKIDPQLITVEVSFVSAPNSPASVIPYLKYNKTSIRQQIVKKELMSEGRLLITLDISKVHKETLFKDFSLLVNSDTPIQGIKVHNARSSSSSLTGLVNISF